MDIGTQLRNKFYAINDREQYIEARAIVIKYGLSRIMNEIVIGLDHPNPITLLNLLLESLIPDLATEYKFPAFV